MTTALLMIDVQASFPARDYWDETLAAPWRIHQRKLLNLASEAGIPMVRIFHEAPGSATPFDPEHGLIRPLEGFDDSAAATFHKRAHNAFTDTALGAWLDARGIRRLVISGIRTEQCCETTARVGSDLGYEVDFVSQATLTFPMQRHGRTWSADEIRARTELVLEGRFARVVEVATLQEEWREHTA
ncbi:MULTISPECIES: isochorismatase family protein [Halomonadaceae]|uniref:isochorismatase family protein n=1 Tax=Halomonadaceae TaxID=28256 RepID=UPI001581DFF6|nr:MULTISPECIES: isochorismatase family protein [Halomonas]MDI4638612.1 isochorismatase family protein [Halomonas sp. BMC7]NUJ59598.1 isochorismatase family protein [Halomonas taeanensis]